MLFSFIYITFGHSGRNGLELAAFQYSIHDLRLAVVNKINIYQVRALDLNECFDFSRSRSPSPVFVRPRLEYPQLAFSVARNGDGFRFRKAHKRRHALFTEYAEQFVRELEERTEAAEDLLRTGR